MKVEVYGFSGIRGFSFAYALKTLSSPERAIHSGQIPMKCTVLFCVRKPPFHIRISNESRSKNACNEGDPR